jgi:hypothetical protein
MNPITRENIYQKSFCHKLKPGDTNVRRKWKFITWPISGYSSSSIVSAGEDIKQKIKEIDHLESAIWRIETFLDTEQLYLYIQTTFNTFNTVNSRTILPELFELFPNAHIIAVDKCGVEKVRKFCSKSSTEVPNIVDSFGKIDILEYTFKSKDNISNVDSDVTVKKVKETGIEKKIDKHIEKIELQPFYDALTETHNELIRERDPAKVEEKKREYESLKEKAKDPELDLIQFAIENAPKNELTVVEKRRNIAMEYNKFLRDFHTYHTRHPQIWSRRDPSGVTNQYPNPNNVNLLRHLDFERLEKEEELKRQEEEGTLSPTEKFPHEKWREKGGVPGVKPEKREPEVLEDAIDPLYKLSLEPAPVVTFSSAEEKIKYDENSKVFAERSKEIIKEKTAYEVRCLTLRQRAGYKQEMENLLELEKRDKEEARKYEEEERKREEERESLNKQILDITEQCRECKDKKKLALLEIQKDELVRLGKISTFSLPVEKKS